MKQAATKHTQLVRWSLRLLIVIAASLSFSGCVGVTPIPVYSRNPEYGVKPALTQTRTINPGQTTRQEVIDLLGTNYVNFPATKSIAYTWEMSGGGGAWWVGIVLFEGAIMKGGNWVGGWRGYFVAFDDGGVVRAAEFKQLSTRRSLHTNMDRWIAHLDPPCPLLAKAHP